MAETRHAPPPPRPMDPGTGLRRIKLQPHQAVDPLTAADDLFVLAHLGIPRIDPARWSLTIDGMVDAARTLSLDELRAMPKVTVEAVHQCCGSPMEPKVPTRRVANVQWGGVDLAAVLGEIGIDHKARFLWSYGLDHGSFAGTECDSYLKDLPLERLQAGDVLLAYELNGAPLPAEHGFPLRLVVPGFYGTNSVKWLWRLCVANRRAEGPFVSVLYNDTLDAKDVAAGLPERRPVWATAPESIIVAPAPDTVVKAGVATEIWGWAWSFRGIARVEVSVDSDRTFAAAYLEKRRGWAWQRFSLPWTPQETGPFVVSARAFEAGGASQPFGGARNAIHSVTVTAE